MPGREKKDDAVKNREKEKKTEVEWAMNREHREVIKSPVESSMTRAHKCEKQHKKGNLFAQIELFCWKQRSGLGRQHTVATFTSLPHLQTSQIVSYS